MHIGTLEELVAEAFTHPNYKFKSRGEVLDSAKKSFNRLAPDQKALAIRSWLKYLEQEGRIQSSNLTPESEVFQRELINLQVYRFLCQTNLFFLCHILEKYNLTTLETHEKICNSHFVQKEPTFASFDEFADQYTGLKESLLLVPRGGFKALDLETEIPTPQGQRKLQDIKVGDKVFGSDGNICNVIAESEVFVNRPCYSVEFSTGEQIVADGDHLWVTDSRRDRDNSRKPCPTIKTTKEISKTLLYHKEHNHRVILGKAVQLPEKSYIISPYVLGCWLGDGTSSCGNLTCADPQIIEEIIKEGETIRKAGYAEILYVFNGGPEHPDYKKHSGISFASRLRQLNVLNNKHIPEAYLFGSYEQRLALLQGLMDTDGTCDIRGHCTFTNTNHRLALQVRELIASLGLKPFNICEYETDCNGVKGIGYQVGFIAYKGIVDVFRLHRKLSRQRPIKKVTLSKYRQIVNVTEVVTRPLKCLMVDSIDNTYLVGRSYIPTHNSSIDIADTAQWALCFPDVTIAIITGVLALSVAFVGELKDHFTLAETGLVDENKKPIYAPRTLLDKKTRELSTSVIQVLFPEHCTKPGDSPQMEWQTPAVLGGRDRSPTVKAASLDQALAGWHHMVLKLDDCVNDENSRTLTRIESVNKSISIMEALLNPNGFKDILGTWYDEADFYGTKINHEVTTAKEEGIETLTGSVDSGRLNSHSYTKIYLRACWWPTEEAEQLGKIEDEMKKSDYVLWFPERLTYEFLNGKRKRDPYFAIKYLNNPRKHHEVKFPRELLIRKTIPYNQLPQQGIIVSTIDTAYSVQSWADFTVMITALIYGGRFYIINMIRGRFNEYDLPKVIASGAYKWKPKRICIEDSMGVKWMSRELRREMDALRISVPVEFVSLGQGSKKNSKKLKAKPVARLLGDDRLLFLNSCEGLNDIYSELEKFTGSNDDTHDDIVSALSLLAEQFGAYADMESKISYAGTQFTADKQATARHNLIYGLGQYKKYNAAEDDNPVTTYEVEQVSKSLGGLDNDFGADPLAEMF